MKVKGQKVDEGLLQKAFENLGENFTFADARIQAVNQGIPHEPAYRAMDRFLQKKRKSMEIFYGDGLWRRFRPR